MYHTVQQSTGSSRMNNSVISVGTHSLLIGLTSLLQLEKHRTQEQRTSFSDLKWPCQEHLSSYIVFFSVVKATLESQMSVCLYVCLYVCHRNPSASQNCSYLPLFLSAIEPINHRAYQPLSLSTIEPKDHWAYQPLSLKTIEPIDHQAYQPSSLLTIEPINHRA